MKTALSIPDNLFREAERLANATQKSRSRLFSDAIREYVSRHAPDEVTEAMNKVVTEISNETDPFRTIAVSRILKKIEW